MFERFDERAREVVVVAGNIAARRERARTGESIPRGVRVQVKDVREALALLAPRHGWNGTFNAATDARFKRLPSTASITTDDLWEMFK